MSIATTSVRLLSLQLPLTDLRYNYPPDCALSMLADSAIAASALFALEQHLDHQMEWFAMLAQALDLSPSREDSQAKEARAKSTANMDRIKALRSDLAEFAAEATLTLGDKMDPTNEIIIPYDPIVLPQTFGKQELLQVEKAFAQELDRIMRKATAALRPLRDRLRRHGDAECLALAERINGFIVGVHGRP